LMSVTSQSLWSTLEKFKDGPPKEYEESIQKLEGDVRMHIRVEQQMRLHIENLQQKIEDLERENSYNLQKVKSDFDDLKIEK
jgi:TolA-binding protein